MSRTRDKVVRRIQEFLDASGKSGVVFAGQSNTIADLGFESDEGVDFVLDLCDEFAFEFPDDFNPFVHENGCRGRSVDELVQAVDSLMTSEVAP